MIRPIIQAPDARLLEPSAPVVRGITVLGDLLGDLVDTRIHAKGAGLSAVQIGHHLRVVCVSPGDFEGYSLLLNPEIVEHGGNMLDGDEGCLSIGDGVPRFRIKRWATVTIRFMDKKGDERVLSKLRYWPARIIQHEIDHLDGKLIA